MNIIKKIIFWIQYRLGRNPGTRKLTTKELTELCSDSQFLPIESIPPFYCIVCREMKTISSAGFSIKADSSIGGWFCGYHKKKELDLAT